MAKKIKVSNARKASESLKKRKIEHVLVVYNHENKEDDAFVVVQNKDLPDAKTVILVDNNTILKVKSVRHYEMIALSHKHYQPTFDCTCRNCGKTFKSVVKEQVCCSAACKKEFRNKKKTV